jgi:hypothetical protein
MLGAVVGITAAVLVTIGLIIIAGPALPRWGRALAALVRQLGEQLFAAPERAPAEPEHDLHPTTQKAIAAAGELSALLKSQGENEMAEELRAAIRKLARDEGRGLLHLHAVARRVRGLHLPEARAQEQARQLGMRLRAAVADRAEQLELLPFR